MNRIFGNWLEHLQRSRRSQLYLLVGLWNTIFGYGVYYLTIYVLQSYAPDLPRPYLWAITMAQILGVLNAYIAHRRHTFADRRSGRMMAEFLRFSMVYVATLLMSFVLLPVLVEGFTIRPDLAGVINLIASTLMSYVAHLRFTFHHHES